MPDKFENQVTGLESPASDGIEIIPDDDIDLIIYTRGFYVGGAGDIKFDTIDGTTITLKNCAESSYHPWRIKKVYETDTTATDIVGLY